MVSINFHQHHWDCRNDCQLYQWNKCCWHKCSNQLRNCVDLLKLVSVIEAFGVTLCSFSFLEPFLIPSRKHLNAILTKKWLCPHLPAVEQIHFMYKSDSYSHMIVFWECVKGFQFFSSVGIHWWGDSRVEETECGRFVVSDSWTSLQFPLLRAAQQYLSQIYITITLSLCRTPFCHEVQFFFICLVNHCVTSHVSLLLAFNSVIITNY